jgi:hypothetical protein
MIPVKSKKPNAALLLVPYLRSFGNSGTVMMEARRHGRYYRHLLLQLLISTRNDLHPDTCRFPASMSYLASMWAGWRGSPRAREIAVVLCPAAFWREAHMCVIVHVRRSDER